MCWEHSPRVNVCRLRIVRSALCLRSCVSSTSSPLLPCGRVRVQPSPKLIVLDSFISFIYTMLLNGIPHSLMKHIVLHVERNSRMNVNGWMSRVPEPGTFHPDRVLAGAALPPPVSFFTRVSASLNVFKDAFHP